MLHRSQNISFCTARAQISLTAFTGLGCRRPHCIASPTFANSRILHLHS